jgi:predicted deacylase
MQIPSEPAKPLNASRAHKLPLEVLPPDLAPYRKGNTGIEYVTTFDSGRPGPHVVISALAHGNEICGAHALCFLFERNIRPRRGKLTLMFANIGAFLRFDPERPFDSRFIDEDFNRLWNADVLAGPRDSRELRRARALLPIVESADLLLDLHSMHSPSAPLMLCGVQDRSLALAKRMAYPPHLVRDPGHDAGRRLRDYGAFDDPAGAKTALLIECGQHWAAASVAVAIEACLRFLRVAEVIPAEEAAPYLREPDVLRPTVIAVSGPVTIASPHFRFVREFQSLETVPEKGTLIARDGEVEIRTPYDCCVLIMPGRNLAPGLTAVRLGRVVES